MDKLISFIVPVYNVQDYLAKCVDSILRCSGFDFQCILVNDGSTDNSLEICRKYQKYDNIDIIDKANGGLSDARNAGLAKAIGKYVIFIDSDDFVTSENLNSLVMDIKNGKEFDILFNDYTIVSKSGAIINKINQANTEKIVYDNDLFYEIINKGGVLFNSWRYVFRRDFLADNDVSFKKGYLCEDVDFFVNTVIKAGKIAVVHKPYYNYVIDRENSIMNVVSIKRVSNFYEIAENSINKLVHSKKKFAPQIIDRIVQSMIFTLPNVWEVEKKYRKIAVDCVKSKAYVMKYTTDFKFKIICRLISLFGVRVVSFLFYILKVIRRILRRCKVVLKRK